MCASILQIVVQYSFYSGCFLFICGLLSNLLNTLTFTQLKMFRDNRCAFYILIESIANGLYISIYLSFTILTAIYGDDASGRSHIWCKLKYISTQIAVLTTLSMICFAAIDQFCSTNHSFNIRQMCSMRLAQCLTSVFICFSIIHSILLGFAFNIQPLDGCVITNHIALQYSTYFFYPILIGFLPLIIATIYGILAFRNVRRIIRRQIPIVRRRLDQQMTALVLSRVILFVCSMTPYDIYRIYIINFPISSSNPAEYAIGRVLNASFSSLATLNYTISFYIFLIISTRFRRQVKLVLMRKIWQRCKFHCLLKHNRIVPEIHEQRTATIESEENF